MPSGSQVPASATSRAALAGLAAGAVGASILGPRIFAGYAAVGLFSGVGLTLRSLGTSGRFLPGLAAGLVVLFPLAASEMGEEGILPAVAVTLMVLAAGFIGRGLKGGAVGSMALSLLVVLHLGLLGYYLVLLAASGNRLLGALFLMVAGFEVAHGLLAGRQSPRAGRPAIDPVAAGAGVVACIASALVASLFLDFGLGLDSFLLLGAVVGAFAALGHVSASGAMEDLFGGRVGAPNPRALAALNALLFAAGVFYYGFRLYLA